MSTNESALQENVQHTLDYSEIVQSSSFQQLLHEKRKFIIPWSIFFLVFYFTLPVLTAYSHILNRTAFGSITWAWLFGSAQFVMTWALCMIYSSRAAKFDKKVDEIKRSLYKEGL